MVAVHWQFMKKIPIILIPSLDVKIVDIIKGVLIVRFALMTALVLLMKSCQMFHVKHKKIKNKLLSYRHIGENGETI